jgi:hypothetical protein
LRCEVYPFDSFDNKREISVQPAIKIIPHPAKAGFGLIAAFCAHVIPQFHDICIDPVAFHTVHHMNDLREKFFHGTDFVMVEQTIAFLIGVDTPSAYSFADSLKITVSHNASQN